MARIPPRYSETFEQFWASYPRTPTMSKKMAFAAWLRLTAEDQALASQALPAYRQWLGKNQWCQACHAATFLNQARWAGFTEQMRVGGVTTHVSCPSAASTFVAVDSPAWRAWEAFYRAHGASNGFRGRPPSIISRATGQEGWFFPTEYPVG